MQLDLETFVYGLAGVVCLIMAFIVGFPLSWDALDAIGDGHWYGRVWSALCTLVVSMVVGYLLFVLGVEAIAVAIE